MAWFNPATWAVVNELQGQNKPISGFSPQASSGGGGGGGGGGGHASASVSGPNGSSNASPQVKSGYVADVTPYNPYDAAASQANAAAAQAAAQRAAQQQAINDTRLQLDDQEGDLRRLLGSVDTQYNVGLGKINDSYNTQLASGQAKYADQFTENSKGRQRALGQVDQGAYTANNSLRRLLGMSGSANQSALKFAAPNAIARDASQKRTVQVENYGANDKKITDAKSEYETNLKTAKAQRELDFKTGMDGQRITLNKELGDIAGQRIALNGGDYNAVRAAREPFKNQANTYQSNIDNMYNNYKSALNATPTLASLNDFTVDKSAINANKGGGGGEYSPYSYFMKKKAGEYNV